ncbi:unnamed protein product [Linum trigynum]
MVDKKRNKVLFAEAGKDFVDFLIYILSLPLSAVAKYVAAPSSITKLHNSIELLEPGGHMKPDPSNTRCSSIVIPHLLTHVPLLPRLTPPVTTPVEKTVYCCVNNHRHVKDMVSKNPTRCRCTGSSGYECNQEMNNRVMFSDSSAQTREADYVKEMIPYMVADDLSVTALNSTSVFHAVKLCEPSNVEEREVEFGSDEALKLLKASLHSDTPLTTVFLRPQVKEETD